MHVDVISVSRDIAEGDQNSISLPLLSHHRQFFYLVLLENELGLFQVGPRAL